MSRPSGTRARDLLPLLPFVVGGIFSAWRFSVHDPIGGLALGLGGTMAMIALGVWSRNAA